MNDEDKQNTINNLILHLSICEEALKQKEIDRQYHMGCINHLAKENGIMGLTSEKTIELTLSRIEDQKQQLLTLEKKLEEAVEALNEASEAIYDAYMEGNDSNGFYLSNAEKDQNKAFYTLAKIRDERSKANP